ncbi:MAG: 50S ribosomal protein L29 [Planctomycetaceae bacterium]|jgi:large subunit ribosomal protein L29|nr:50S ribosomal protein L29 [Planctomycetaceae bacterium]
MNITKMVELRTMTDEQLGVVLKDARDSLFRLCLQARMERLDSPSELKKNKKLIARILTIKSLRKHEELQASKEAGAKN